MNYGIVLAILFVILTMVYLIVFKALDVKNEHSCKEDMNKCKNLSHDHHKAKNSKTVKDFIKSDKHEGEEYYFSSKSLKNKNNKKEKSKKVAENSKKVVEKSKNVKTSAKKKNSGKKKKK